MVNFIAKFDIDGGETTDLSLEVTEYDEMEPTVEAEPTMEAAEPVEAQAE